MKRQFAFLFITLITGTILLCLLLNSTLLGTYYLNRKQNALVSAYHSINEASNAGDITTEEYDIELKKICEKYNIQVLVADGESEAVKYSMNDPQRVLKQLFDNIFLGVDEESLLQSTADYKMRVVQDFKTQTEYVEMWGMLDNGYLFILRSALEGIRESVSISNHFLAYVGVAAILVSVLLVVWISNRVTKPILELAAISERMKHLDFDAKYTGEDKTEIAILGNNINELSEALESTISELKTANNELLKDIERKERMDERRREFLSNVSHELKTPLALIQGYAEGLKEGINDDPESREFYCDVIMDEAAKMNAMVKNLLTLNQLEAGNEIVSMERFDVTTLIKNQIAASDILLKQKEISVRMEDYGQVYVWGDEFRVEEVFTNYLTNAINYAQGEKIVDVKILETKERVRISVFNTGDPIPQESVAHLWEKFYKVDKARSREYGGSGIGLSIVKAIMESMNQKYGVVNYDNGVEFWFELDPAQPLES
ncbi:MAG: HAMP domain-containing histidine kinase [Bacteroidales bacterium]|nr:HAMP domain-containing histidine kinase [Bacteroidales bacterium]MCM1416526.1 HAMP domain-containing histidine kinase [bacterium]MCM1424537.1 HAMP domain-containing histidine kinase [bacterium]